MYYSSRRRDEDPPPPSYEELYPNSSRSNPPTPTIRTCIDPNDAPLIDLSDDTIETEPNSPTSQSLINYWNRLRLTVTRSDFLAFNESTINSELSQSRFDLTVSI